MTIKTLAGDNREMKVCDVMDGLRSIPDESVQCCVTSPPYWGLRDYGFSGQIGSEESPTEFVDKLVSVFQEVRRVLRQDGTLFLNLGDSYSKDSKYRGMSGSKHLPAAAAGVVPRCYRRSGLANGNLCGMPWRVALALQLDGWILRQCIVWDKPNPMPESISGMRWSRCRVRTQKNSNIDNGKNGSHVDRRKVGFNERYADPETHSAKFVDCSGCEACSPNGGYVLRKGSWRPTTSHEFIFMFTKSQMYFCDGDGCQEAVSGNAHSRGTGLNAKAMGVEFSSAANAVKQNQSFSSSVSGLVETRNPRSVWKISTEGYSGSHFACFPTELVRRCLTAGISPQGCCSDCGAALAPVVDSVRAATRPGRSSKSYQKDYSGKIQQERIDSNRIGNRDPQRHTTVRRVLEYRPICSCVGRHELNRCVVLDPFSGSATTGQVAINMNGHYIGIEANEEYAQLGIQRLKTPWIPVNQRRTKQRKHPRRTKFGESQSVLF